MAFCVNCGQELAEDDKFCSECGTAVSTTSAIKRRVVYDGEVHKCPNCGGVLGSFVIVCPSCGYEFRGVSSSIAVQEFAVKLTLTESHQEKTTIIRNFPIPNTKEDLFEFIILAGANIRKNRYDDDLSEEEKEISDAWRAKFEQAYLKAKIVFKNDKLFQKIEELYNEKTEEQKRAKFKSGVPLAALIVGVTLTTALAIGSIFFFDHISIENETERLEAIVEEVYTYIEQGEYVLARSKVSTLVFSGSTSRAGYQAAAKWDITRQQLLDIIDKAEFGDDYVPQAREIRIGVSQNDLKGENYSEVKAQLENRGFTNIQTDAVKDLLTGWWTSEGSVDRVSVGGDTVFSEDSVYSSDVEIIIYYHAKK